MRCLDNVILAFLNYVSMQESPELFKTWTAISVMSATLGRNVWIDRGFYRIFPNHYIILLAASAECRKSVIARIGMDLLTKAKIIEIGAERITNAALWQWLDEAREKTGKSEIFIFSDELGLSLSKEETQKGVISTLTRAYHCPDLLINKTKTAGVDQVENCCINILAATTPTDFAAIIPGASTGTGFTSRLHSAYQEIPCPRRAELIKDKELEKRLIQDLQHIRALKGEIAIEPDAWAWWKHWYEKELKFPENELLDSFYGRKHDYVLKLGMIVSLSEQDELVVRKKDLTRALPLLNQLESFMGDTYSMVGGEPYLLHADRVVKQLLKAGGKLSRSEILQRNSRQIGAEELTRIMLHLQAAETVQSQMVGGKTIYLLKGGKKDGK